MRTLEQKISDAGPNPQRNDTHILTTARKELVNEGKLSEHKTSNATWFHLAQIPFSSLRVRFQDQYNIHQRLQNGDLTERIGQTLEIAVYRALKLQSKLKYLGSFSDLDDHDDSSLYKKEEPQSTISGLSLLGKMKLDYALFGGEAELAGIEVKNVREW